MCEAIARHNARDLFTFLKEFTELRMRAVRSIDQYEKVLWLSDVPREKGAFAQHGTGAMKKDSTAKRGWKSASLGSFLPRHLGLSWNRGSLPSKLRILRRRSAKRFPSAVKGGDGESGRSNGDVSKISRKFARYGPSTLKTSGGPGRKSING